MEFQTLITGYKMPLVGLGTYQTDGDDCFNSVIWALEAGYRLLDTAQGYKNEQIVGDAMKKSGVKREDIFLVTKVNFKNFEKCYQSVMESLEKLKTDYLDLVLLHWPYNNYYAAWRDLEKLYKEGVIRSIGVSNFEPDRLIDLINYNEIKPHVNQIETNLLCQRIEHKAWMEKYDCAHMAYTPLGQNRRNEMFAFEEVSKLAEKYSKTKAQIMLRFLTQCNMTVIPKSVHKERIIENISIFDFSLTKEEIESLKKLDTNTALVGTPADPNRVVRSITW